MKTLDEKQKGLQAYSAIGQTVTLRGTHVRNIVDEVHVVSLGYKHSIERIRQLPEHREATGEFAYRFCYYAPSENGRKVFGQYGTLFPEAALRELLRRCPRKRLANLRVMGNAIARSAVAELAIRRPRNIK